MHGFGIWTFGIWTVQYYITLEDRHSFLNPYVTMIRLLCHSCFTVIAFSINSKNSSLKSEKVLLKVSSSSIKASCSLK